MLGIGVLGLRTASAGRLRSPLWGEVKQKLVLAVHYAGVREFDLQVFERLLYALVLFALPYFLLTLCFSLPSQRRREAERRQTQVTNRRVKRRGARSYGARTLAGVPPRLSPKGIIPSQRLSFRPCFLGRGLNGRYPPSPVPVQGSTSRPGRNAGGLIPKPPGSSVQNHPRAPHPLHLSACLRKASFGERDKFRCN